MRACHKAQFAEFEEKEEIEKTAATACRPKHRQLRSASLTACSPSMKHGVDNIENVVANMHEPAGLPPQKQFKFLAKKLTTHINTEASLLIQDMGLASYIAEYQAGKIMTSELEFWQQKQLVYPALSPCQLHRSILKVF